MERVKNWRRPGASGVLYRAAALEFLSSQRKGSMDLIFLDPPFNLGKEYSSHFPDLDDRGDDEYRRWLVSILRAAVRALSPGGALFLYHLPEWAHRAASVLEESLDFRHWIAIAMKNGFARGEKLYPAHYALLYFTNGPPAAFTRPKIDPLTCRHCGGYVRDYGGYKPIIEEKGVNLSDVWDDISPVRHPANKFRDANELPSTITDRVVGISGFENGTFCDPFAGTGAAVISAVAAGMRFRANDLVEKNCRVIKERVDQFKASRRASPAGVE